MGGMAGHMLHLHESMGLTFGEIKSALKDVVSAEIEAVEKVDGQNLFFTWNAQAGQIRTARGAGDIEGGGMSPSEFAAKWKGHPAEDAFTQGFEAIESAIGGLAEEDLRAIFGNNGDRYVNAEIMYVDNPNMILYDGNYIVVHNLQDFGDKTGPIRSGEFERLVDAIEGYEAQTSEADWSIHGPQLTSIRDIADGIHYTNFVSALNAASGGMSDSASIGDFVAERLRVGPVGDMKMSIERQERLIDRIVGVASGKSAKDLPDIRNLKKGLDKTTQKRISQLATTSTAHKTVGVITAPIARTISDFAVEVLRGMRSFFVTDHDGEIQRMRNMLDAAINKIQSYRGANAEEVGQMLVSQLEKLGSLENVATTIEGIVFEYPPGSDQLYKLTGSFAMINQIVGRARRLPE